MTCVRVCVSFYARTETKTVTGVTPPPADRTQIERYNANSGTHTLFYEDGEVRDSDMSQRGFRVCYRPPGWTPPHLAADPAADPAPAVGPATEEAPAGQQAQDAVWGRRRQSPLAPRPPADYAPDTSAYVIAALNRFGDAGGMAPLAQRLSGGRASFGEVLETFRLGKALRTHASSRALKEVNWALKECAVAALLSMPPESMRAASKAEIAECVASVRQLALTLSSASTAANPPAVLLQELEQLELALAMKVGRDGGRRGRVGGRVGRGAGESRVYRELEGRTNEARMQTAVLSVAFVMFWALIARRARCLSGLPCMGGWLVLFRRSNLSRVHGVLVTGRWFLTAVVTPPWPIVSLLD